MLSYQPTYFFEKDLTGGISTANYDAGFERLKAAYAAVQSQKQAGSLPFAKLPYDKNGLAAIQQTASELAGKFKQIVLIGIGGSDLGARAAFRALCSPYFNTNEAVRNGAPQLFFAGDTTDPEPLTQLSRILNWAETLVIVVSKSGNTIEQMSSFVYLRSRLIEALGEEKSREHIVTITDAASGTLREITDEEGYKNIIHPEVGGRFSVLSSVGLFPLALVGVDIQALCNGAADLDALETEEPSLPAQFAYHQYLAYTKGQHVSVMFPYVYGLREFGQWYRQLWAESLGKKVNKAGEVVNVGPTPIAAVGPTDQHSQVQLYMEGPNDKIMTFIRSKATPQDIILPEAFPHKEGVKYLAGLSMQTILTAEQEATAQALAHEGHPSLLIEVDRIDAYHLGQLFYFFELATAYAGELFDVNAYDQPGVELGKQLMFKKLGR
jgi:glucose-6-phosphate isomerase